MYICSHWTLYEAMKYSTYISAKLLVWQPTSQQTIQKPLEVCIYMYVCICVCVYVCMCVCVYMCICVYVYMCICVCVHVCVIHIGQVYIYMYMFSVYMFYIIIEFISTRWCWCS